MERKGPWEFKTNRSQEHHSIIQGDRFREKKKKRNTTRRREKKEEIGGSHRIKSPRWRKKRFDMHLVRHDPAGPSSASFRRRKKGGVGAVCR